MTDLFEGTWKFDHSDTRSLAYDRATATYGPDPVEDETVVLRTADGIQHCEVRYGVEPTVILGYSSSNESTDWTPYVVLGIEGDAKTPTDQLRSDRYRVGESLCHLRIVSADERTSYRVVRSLSGAAQYVLCRWLSDDLASYTSTIMAPDGVVTGRKIFRRQS